MISIMKIEILISLTSVISVILALHPDSGALGKIVGGVEAPKRKDHNLQIFWERPNNLKKKSPTLF